MRLLGFNAKTGIIQELPVADNEIATIHNFFAASGSGQISRCFHALSSGLGVIYDSNTPNAQSALCTEKCDFPYNAVIAKYNDDTEQYGDITKVELSQLMDDLVIKNMRKEGHLLI